MQSQRQTPARKRLKDSCNNCASMKVKCSKDKPTCTRCEDREIECYYSPSQRSGRRVSAAPASNTNTTPAEPINIESNSKLSNNTSNGLGSDDPQYSYYRQNFFDGDALPLWGGEGISNFNLDNSAFNSGTTTPQTDALMGNTGFTSMDQCFNGPDFSPSNAFDNVDSLLNNFNGGSFSSPPTPPFSDSYSNPFFDDKRCNTNGVHSCLTLALNILPILHIPPPTCSVASIRPSERTSSCPTIDNVISTNKAVLDSITMVLSCSCSLDEHLAFILSLIAFKVMAWYAAAARDADEDDSDHSSPPTTERVQHLSITVGKYRLKGAEHSRMRAQLILSELHRVVRSVELLSKRFERARLRSSMPATPGEEHTMARSDWISASIFVQLEADLRKRLQAVTNETMTILRCA
jgi:Aflatoxin regulatory protein/Fungal Zn(2)-Cys(6) binuclear cluster domain